MTTEKSPSFEVAQAPVVGFRIEITRRCKRCTYRVHLNIITLTEPGRHIRP